MSESKQPQVEEVLKPLDDASVRYQELQRLWDERVTQRKTVISQEPGDSQNVSDFDELQLRPLEEEMREIVNVNRSKGGVIDIDGKVIKLTKQIKVKSLKTDKMVGLDAQRKNLSPKKKAAAFKSQPVTIEEKQSVTLGPKFKDPITGDAINPDNVAMDTIAAGQVAPVNSSLAVNAEMPNNRPEEPIADNKAEMPAQANAVELNDAGLLNAEAVEQVEADVKVPEPQSQSLMGVVISRFSSPPGHHYTGAGTPVVDNIYNKKKVPINALDMISMIHDIGYQTATDINDIERADDNMIADIDNVIQNYQPDPSLRVQLEIAKKALQGKRVLEGPGAGITPVDFEANKKYLEDNPEIEVALQGILTDFNEMMKRDIDITKSEVRERFINGINTNRPTENIRGLERDKPALQAQFREVPSLVREKGLEGKMEGAEGEEGEEDEQVIASVGGLGDLGEMFEQEAKDITKERRAFINRQRMNINERDYQDFLRNKQMKEQRIQELNKRERGLPQWLRPEFKKIYEQLDQLAYYSSPEFTEAENKLRYDQDRIRRGQSEQTDMSEQGLNIANNLTEREMKLRFDLPLDRPLWSAPTRGNVTYIPQDNYRVGYSRPYNREGEASFIENTRNGVGLYNSSFPHPINNLRRNYSMPPMRAQVHQMPRNPIDRDQFRHVRMMDRTPRGTATVLNDDFDGLNYKDDRRRDFERGMSLGERLQFEMFHMNN